MLDILDNTITRYIVIDTENNDVIRVNCDISYENECDGYSVRHDNRESMIKELQHILELLQA